MELRRAAHTIVMRWLRSDRPARDRGLRCPYASSSLSFERRVHRPRGMTREGRSRRRNPVSLRYRRRSTQPFASLPRSSDPGPVSATHAVPGRRTPPSRSSGRRPRDGRSRPGTRRRHRHRRARTTTGRPRRNACNRSCAGRFPDVPRAQRSTAGRHDQVPSVAACDALHRAWGSLAWARSMAATSRSSSVAAGSGRLVCAPAIAPPVPSCAAARSDGVSPSSGR
jgi:hypothetical protein